MSFMAGVWLDQLTRLMMSGYIVLLLEMAVWLGLKSEILDIMRSSVGHWIMGRSMDRSAMRKSVRPVSYEEICDTIQ